MPKVLKAIAVFIVFTLVGAEVNAQTDTKVVVIAMPGDDTSAVMPLGPFVALGDHGHRVYVAINLADGTYTARVGAAPAASESLSFRTQAGPFAYEAHNGIWDSVSNTGSNIFVNTSHGYAFSSTLAQGGEEYVLYAKIWESGSAEITVDDLIVLKK